MPSDGAREEGSLFLQLLGVVLAKVVVRCGVGMESEDVSGRLKLRYSYEADLQDQWLVR